VDILKILFSALKTCVKVYSDRLQAARKYQKIHFTSKKCLSAQGKDHTRQGLRAMQQWVNCPQTVLITPQKAPSAR
jgi:hypothetical protein